MFTEEIISRINSSVLCWLATADAHGWIFFLTPVLTSV
jgi:hypothetical protein